MGDIRARYLYYADNIEALLEDGEKAAHIAPDAIGEALAQQAESYHFWAQLASMAGREVTKQEQLIADRTIPDVRAEIRSRFRQEKEKETVDRVDDAMKLTPVYREARGRLEKVRYLFQVFENIRYSLEHKRDCLRSLNSRQRGEL